MVKRFDIYLISLDPAQGSEIKKMRPCVVVSPNEMHYLNTIIVAPMTTKSKPYPMRVPIVFSGKEGYIVLDQIRTVSKTRLVKKLGVIENAIGNQVLHVLQEMFTAS